MCFEKALESSLAGQLDDVGCQGVPRASSDNRKQAIIDDGAAHKRQRAYVEDERERERCGRLDTS